MNFEDSENVPEDVLSALKGDGELAAPPGARTRVLARLGVAAAAGAAVATQASAASAALGKAAGTSAAPAAGGLLGFGLVKGLVAHPILSAVAALSVGSSVGLGAYQTFKPPQPPAAVAQTSAPAPVQAAPAPAPIQAAPAPAPTPDLSPPPAPAPASTPDPVRPPASPRPALSPAPDLPKTDAPARLAEQQALLDQARTSLRRGDGAGALAIVASHEAHYPVTAFAEERAAIQILALVMVGRSSDAAAHAARFAERFPTSLFLPSIRSSLGRNESSPSRPQGASE